MTIKAAAAASVRNRISEKRLITQSVDEFANRIGFTYLEGAERLLCRRFFAAGLSASTRPTRRLSTRSSYSVTAN
jgi:hypothetical protein